MDDPEIVEVTRATPPVAVPEGVQPIRVRELRGEQAILWPPPPDIPVPTQILSIRRVKGAPGFRSLHLEGFHYAVVLQDEDLVVPA